MHRRVHPSRDWTSSRNKHRIAFFFSRGELKKWVPEDWRLVVLWRGGLRITWLTLLGLVLWSSNIDSAKNEWILLQIAEFFYFFVKWTGMNETNRYMRKLYGRFTLLIIVLEKNWNFIFRENMKKRYANQNRIIVS